MKPLLLLSLLLTLVLTACQSAPSTPGPAAPALPASTGTILDPQGLIQRIHDPVMAHEGGMYYVYSTGSRIPFICSPDMITWESCGRVFERNPEPLPQHLGALSAAVVREKCDLGFAQDPDGDVGGAILRDRARV